jgi:signal transduction histidine kinase/ActR/RegA family two-component response regulator
MWSLRVRLYAIALALTVCYLAIGYLSNPNRTWAEVYLPLSAASILVFGLAAAETYLYILRLEGQHEELKAGQVSEQELSQRVAAQRQSLLNEISRALIDKLDFSQLAPKALAKVGELFEADVVAAWQVDRGVSGNFILKGAFRVDTPKLEQLRQQRWTFPEFGQAPGAVRQIVVENVSQKLMPSLAQFWEDEKVVTAVLSPIVRRSELVGVLGVFYRRRLVIAPRLAAEMQCVANIMAGAIQAEELYLDLVQVQKIDSIGSLASGIAHDLNNMLAAILACANYVKQQTDPSHATYRYLEAIESSSHRGAALTKQLLSFARRERRKLTVLDPNEYIEQTLKIVERSFDKTILIQRQFAKDLRPIEADVSQLEQVVLNIALNARDAMPMGGMFTISTRNVLLNSKIPHRPDVLVPDGEYVVLGFRDTGSGMDAKTKKHAFDPFFTTKPKSIGLGLSVARNVVKSFGGAIRMESEQGKGALLEVFLPVTSKPLPKVEDLSKAVARGGRECILLVEDEEIIREMAQMALEAKGYTVLAAADGAAALSIYRDQWQGIDLVVADMVMPRISGPELVARMKEVNQNVRVVVSSGYSPDLEGQRMLQHGCLGYLQKPYNTEDLCKIIRSVLDSGL